MLFENRILLTMVQLGKCNLTNINPDIWRHDIDPQVFLLHCNSWGDI